MSVCVCVQIFSYDCRSFSWSSVYFFSLFFLSLSLGLLRRNGYVCTIELWFFFYRLIWAFLHRISFLFTCVIACVCMCVYVFRFSSSSEFVCLMWEKTFISMAESSSVYVGFHIKCMKFLFAHFFCILTCIVVRMWPGRAAARMSYIQSHTFLFIYVVRLRAFFPCYCLSIFYFFFSSTFATFFSSLWAHAHTTYIHVCAILRLPVICTKLHASYCKNSLHGKFENVNQLIPSYAFRFSSFFSH